MANSDKPGPRKKDDIEKDIAKHFVGEDGKLYQDEMELPDYKKADAEMKEKLAEKFEREKEIIINLGKLKIEGAIMTLIKLIFGVVALIAAALFTFLFPGAGFEQLVIGVVTSIAAALGIGNWRTSYGLAKEWFQSKSIVSALIAGVAVLAVTLLSFFAIAVPEVVMTILKGLVAIFGGTTLWGIFDAMNKSNSDPNKLRSFMIFFLTAGATAALITDLYLAGGSTGVISLAAITAVTGTTKATAHKTARQRSFQAKEVPGDSYVAAPPEWIKSLTMRITGVNEEGAFGENTIGQKMEGEIIIFAAEAAARTFCHELVTKHIQGVQMTTNGGQSYTFATTDGTPALSFAYDESLLVSEKDDATIIKLKITGYRDNLVQS